MTLETAKPSSASKSKKIAIVDDVIGHSKNCRKENCLFVRYRNRKPPSRDEIRLLHPNIIDVRFPRQKSAKFCHLEFETKEAALEAFKQLKKTCKKEMLIQYLGGSRPQPKSKSVSVDNSVDEEQSENASSAEEDEDASAEETSDFEEKVTKKPKSDKDQGSSKCLHVSGLPDLAVKEVVQNLFSTSKTIVIGDKKTKGKRYALVHFESSEEATRAMEVSKDVSVNGDMLTVKFHV